jgi:hypothetical protein
LTGLKSRSKGTGCSSIAPLAKGRTGNSRIGDLRYLQLRTLRRIDADVEER